MIIQISRERPKYSKPFSTMQRGTFVQLMQTLLEQSHITRLMGKKKALGVALIPTCMAYRAGKEPQ
jgi:hypothetical protein